MEHNLQAVRVRNECFSKILTSQKRIQLKWSFDSPVPIFTKRQTRSVGVARRWPRRRCCRHGRRCRRRRSSSSGCCCGCAVQSVTIPAIHRVVGTVIIEQAITINAIVTISVSDVRARSRIAVTVVTVLYTVTTTTLAPIVELKIIAGVGPIVASVAETCCFAACATRRTDAIR